MSTVPVAEAPQHEMKALTIRQPWAWAVFHAGKNVENRPLRSHYRGTIAVHTSKKLAEGWEEYYPKKALKVPPREEWITGVIIGLVDIVDCVEDSRSKWFIGPFGYVLENPRVLRKTVLCKGAQGFWEVPPAVLKRCKV